MLQKHKSSIFKQPTHKLSFKQVRISSDLFILLRRPNVSSPQTEKIRGPQCTNYGRGSARSDAVFGCLMLVRVVAELTVTMSKLLAQWPTMKGRPTDANRDLEMLRFVDTPSQQLHIICVFFFVFIANVSVSISFERLHFRFYNISVFKITIISVSVSVNVGSIIFVSVIVSVTEISLLETEENEDGSRPEEEVFHRPTILPCSSQWPQRKEAPNHCSVILGYKQTVRTPETCQLQQLQHINTTITLISLLWRWWLVDSKGITLPYLTLPSGWAVLATQCWGRIRLDECAYKI